MKIMTKCVTITSNQNHVAGVDKQKQENLSTPGKVSSPVWELFGFCKKTEC